MICITYVVVLLVSALYVCDFVVKRLNSVCNSGA